MIVREIGDGIVELDLSGHSPDDLAEVEALREQVAAGIAAGWRRVQTLHDPDDVVTHRVAARLGLRHEGTMRGIGPGHGDRVVMARLASDPGPETREGFLGVLNTTMPTKRNIAQTLLRDPDGRVLLCELTYKREWDLPGGIVDPGEPPSATAEREVAEELGLDLPARDLLVVDWLPPYRGWSDATLFVFDGGVHPAYLVDRVTLQPREIRALHWATPEQVREHCAPYVVTLLERLAATPAGSGTAYLVDGHPRA